ncbi:hypothetical protein BJ508DRAFT_234381 [Ascobolus immersus RN42]|uniref:Uncharacterized protein n=1 Tax=Ascobolus immersus RN42 TaxID=1160509 RepID=A0A3N4IM19_ASCIM|nr:hypothetical protein BJ508DRAFT_234381 [Ascobolus immersus RN42]
MSAPNYGETHYPQPLVDRDGAEVEGLKSQHTDVRHSFSHPGPPAIPDTIPENQPLDLSPTTSLDQTDSKSLAASTATQSSIFSSAASTVLEKVESVLPNTVQETVHEVVDAVQQTKQNITEVTPPNTTFSHVLAAKHDTTTIDGELKVHRQIEGTDTDLWEDSTDVESLEDENKDSEPFWKPSLDEEEYWALIRRFNKQMHSVRVIHDDEPPGDLDLNISDEEEFSPDKLRSIMERIYTTIMLGSLNGIKHIMRLRSWREAQRTTYFMIAYFIAWGLNLLAPLFIGTMLLLIVSPSARARLFPPAPIALIDAATGDLQEPPAGVLGSDDTFTGAPQQHYGEAAEQEAFTFVSALGSILVAAGTGENPLEKDGTLTGSENKKVDQKDEKRGGPSGVNRISVAAQVLDTKGVLEGLPSSTKVDRSRRPMEAALWDKTRPVVRIMGVVADFWERLANALSPTPPFPTTARLQLAAFVAPVFLASFIITPTFLIHTSTFTFGVLFFSQPLIDGILEYLNRECPGWYKIIDPRNYVLPSSVLRHIPTNAQLTLTLLRMHATAANPSLPVAPKATEVPQEGLDIHPEDLPMPVSEEELHDKVSPVDPQKANPDPKTDPEHPHRSKLVHALRKVTKAGFVSALGADRLKAAVGSKTSKKRVGAVPIVSSTPPTPTEEIDPLESTAGAADTEHHEKKAAVAKKKGLTDRNWYFSARFNGKKGYLCITPPSPQHMKPHSNPATNFSQMEMSKPMLSFYQIRPTSSKPKSEPLFSFPLEDIVEIRKVGGLGWKTKMVAGWSLERSVVDGIILRTRKGLHGGRQGGGEGEKGLGGEGPTGDKRGEREWRIMAVRKRDEVFNALLVSCTSEGESRKWESI